MPTLSEAVKTGRLEDFIQQEEKRGIEPANRLGAVRIDDTPFLLPGPQFGRAMLHEQKNRYSDGSGYGLDAPLPPGHGLLGIGTGEAQALCQAKLGKPEGGAGGLEGGGCHGLPARPQCPCGPLRLSGG